MIDLPESPRPFVLGITGNIACGKTAVLQMLGELGADTIDADEVYHELIEPDRPLWRSVIDHFGKDLIGPDRQLDRRKLGAHVFSDPVALSELEHLTHPAIHDAIVQRIAGSTSPVVAVDAVKLIEGGLDQLCDRVWLITCTPDQQRTRLMHRNGFSDTEANQRIAAQSPLGPKISRADRLIDNSGTLDATRAQVVCAWNELPVHAPALD